MFHDRSKSWFQKLLILRYPCWECNLAYALQDKQSLQIFYKRRVNRDFIFYSIKSNQHGKTTIYCRGSHALPGRPEAELFLSCHSLSTSMELIPNFPCLFSSSSWCTFEDPFLTRLSTVGIRLFSLLFFVKADAPFIQSHVCRLLFQRHAYGARGERTLVTKAFWF